MLGLVSAPSVEDAKLFLLSSARKCGSTESAAAREQRANRREENPRRLIGRDAVDGRTVRLDGQPSSVGPVYSTDVSIGEPAYPYCTVETAASNVPSEGDVPKRGLNERDPGWYRCHVGVKQTLIGTAPNSQPRSSINR